ncbi:MAG: autotransporter outer membrane beta-barrel domain-containing protein [Endomicrobium sp.]|nr:autotransporter outer membrane beta-barrel domain-containing protein [Endomicrobium sp.]
MNRLLVILAAIVVFAAGSFAASTSTILDVSPISHNQNEVQNFFNNYHGSAGSDLNVFKVAIANMSENGNREGVKAAFEDLSGGFLINVLSAQGNLKNYLKLFDRIKKNKSDVYILDQVVWFQFDFDSFENKDEDAKTFKSSKSEWQAGVDMLKGDSITLGLYIGNGSNNVEQGANKADIGFFEFGLYGASINRYINILGNLGLEIQKFHTVRQIRFASLSPESNFNSNAFKWGLEFEVNMLNQGYHRLSPFIGIGGIHQSYDAIKENGGGAANLMIERGAYTKNIINYGLRGQTRAYNFNFSASLYGGYIMAGSDFSKTVSFQQSNQYGMNIINSPTDSVYMGINLGVGRIISDIAEIYINTDFTRADDFSGFFIQGGIKLGFGNEKPKPVRQTRRVVRTAPDTYPYETEVELKREIRTQTREPVRIQTQEPDRPINRVYIEDIDDVQSEDWMSDRMLETVTETSIKEKEPAAVQKPVQKTVQKTVQKPAQKTAQKTTKKTTVKKPAAKKTAVQSKTAAKSSAAKKDDENLIVEFSINKNTAK